MECWAAKVQGGESVLRPQRPRTQPLLDGLLDDLVLILMVLVATGLAGLLVRLIIDYYGVLARVR